jgi:hypothetical protein
MSRLVALAGLSLVFALCVPPVSAQDVSSGTPTVVSLAEGACVPPPMLASSPTPEAASPEPQPQADTGMQATPEIDAAGAGTPADEELAERVMVAVKNLVNCFNAGDYDVVAAWHTPEALFRFFGTTDPVEAAAFLEAVPAVELESAENVLVLDDGRITVDVTVVIGGERMRGLDVWVDRSGILYFDDTEELPIGGTATP